MLGRKCFGFFWQKLRYIVIVLCIVFIIILGLFPARTPGLSCDTFPSKINNPTIIEDPDKPMTKKIHIYKLATKLTYVPSEFQYKRQRRLLQVCRKRYRYRSFNPLVHKRKNMWHNDQLGLIYCYVPKVACTNWKRVMQTFNGKLEHPLAVKDKEHVHRLRHPTLMRLSGHQISKRVNVYYSFFFVRHPIERIVSAYRNKFEDPYSPLFQKHYGSIILKLFREGLTEEEYKSGKGATFDEFVRYIINKVKYGKIYDLNEHWQTIENLCHPCAMKYSFVGKMETLVPDAERVLLEGGWWNTTITFPSQARDKYETNANFELVKRYTKTLSNETIDKLIDIYSFDMEAFDYKFDKSWRPS